MGTLKLCIALFCLLFIQIEATETGEANRNCPNDSLPCNDGECVSREKWCDGKKNCQDESDEAYCKKKYFWTSDNPNDCNNITHFLCNNGECIPLVGQCDGIKDCKDNSDEWNCEPGAYDEYDDYMLSKSTTVVPTETTTIESISDSDESEIDDIATTTQSPYLAVTQAAPLPSSTRSFYAKRIEQDNMQTDMPHSTKASTTTPKALPVTGSITSQLTVKSTTSSLPPASHPTKAIQSPRSSSNYILTSTRPAFEHIRQPTVPMPPPSTQPKIYSQAGYNSGHIQSSTQPSMSSSSRHINPNLPISSFPQTRTDGYNHPTQPLRPQESSREIPGNHQRNLPTSHSTLQQPYDARQSRQQPYDPRQQFYEQFYDTRRQTYDNRQQPYDPRRNPDQFQSQVSRTNSYLGQPVRQSQYPQHLTITGATINGFHIYRIVSRDGKPLYDGYYNQDGHFVTVNTNQRQGWYQQHSTAPPRRTRPQPLTISTAAPLFFDGKLKANSRFYFAKNNTRINLRGNAEYIEKGRDWILSIRDSEGGWGKDTPRALIALSLINNSFVNDTYENNIMQKQFQVFLGTSLIRGDTKTTNVNRLAMSVNALIATCQNPRDFHGTDYTDLIRSRLREQHGVHSANPFVYLSLCLADRNLDRNEVHDLIIRLQSHDSPDEFEQDKQTMAISALSCNRHRQKAIDSQSSEYQRYMDNLLSNATSKLLTRMRKDGSFGSVYSTAIAAQALLSVNDTKGWNPELNGTFQFLRKHQKDDGSFGDFLATYLVLPALSGRSLLHLRNTQCTPPNSDRALTPTEILEYRGPKHHIRYSLFFGYPKTNGYSIEVLVPVGISCFDIMRVAAHKNDAFKFSYEERDGGIHVYSISNVPNDSERGLEWILYVTRRFDLEVDNPESLSAFRMDIEKFYPSSDQHVIFWYKPNKEWI